MGERAVQDEQRERLSALNRMTRRNVLVGAAFLGFAIVMGIVLGDGWTAYLFGGVLLLGQAVVIFVAHRRYILREPFPRLPPGLRADAPEPPQR
ncbi:hypothetical protein [Actinokineospora bangkokensis]|uniref:Uncharacterized protein n=1 Tax=Actinokineospora bangkokensis TaxID=1193682 RepID=A0A1Q9LMA1_9PSEU|nr:hypothetical protein [Actinokineospora bangkokensis]OLR93166.1 hypothetical protein BJP25_16840 [Actinokineospora bangkokensis]